MITYGVKDRDGELYTITAIHPKKGLIKKIDLTWEEAKHFKKLWRWLGIEGRIRKQK